jgi:hypothetical protein
MNESQPKREELSHHVHLDDAVRQPDTATQGFVSLGRIPQHQAEAGQGSGPNPAAPPRPQTPSAHERLRRQSEGR